MENEKYELKIAYPKAETDELSIKIKKVAAQNNGELKLEKENGEAAELEFVFNDVADRDFFHEISNLLISEHYSLYFDAETPETQFDTRMFPEGIYHHFRFEDEYAAWRCANMLTATFATYCLEESYDVTVVKVEDNEAGDEFLVVFGFPFESVILMPEEIEDFMDSLSEDQTDLFALMPEKSKNKEKLN